MSDQGNATPPGDAGTPPAPAAAVKPDWLPDSHWDAKAGTIGQSFAPHYAELSALHRTETERRAALPKTPDDYTFEFKPPEGFKVPDGLPEGTKIGINKDDPRIPQVR